MNDAVTDTHGLIWYLENSPQVVPELPDRIIAATALYLGLPLISRDRAIQQASIEVVW